LAVQAGCEFLVGELAQGVALQAHGRAAVDAHADDLYLTCFFGERNWSFKEREFTS
jgi:hypothetical protein